MTSPLKVQTYLHTLYVSAQYPISKLKLPHNGHAIRHQSWNWTSLKVLNQSWRMLKFKLIKSLNLKQTQMKTENSKMIGNFKRNFCASIHFKLNGVAQGWSRGTVQAALISSCEALELHSRMKEKLCARLRPSSPFLSFLCFYGSSGGPTSEAIAASTASILTEFIQTKMDGQASRSGMDHSKDTHDQSIETHSISNSIVHLDCLYFYVVVHSRRNWQFLRHKNWR